MKPIVIGFSEKYSLQSSILRKWDVDTVTLNLRSFPDGETYLQFEGTVKDRDVVFLRELDRPNEKILPLLFASFTAKDLGSKSVGLCAPYLPYMRQDKRFHEGEGITSTYFANLLSGHFDWLVTIDPHLHRNHELCDIYSISSTALHAAPCISHWISKNIEKPLIIGPDSESEQWVGQVAKAAGAPFTILEKIRQGDREVEVSIPDLTPYQNHTPVLVDDIISTARTMIEIINHLKSTTLPPPVCVVVHAVFSDKAYESLQQAGAAKVVSCNTIDHPSNQIDLSTLIIDGIKNQL